MPINDILEYIKNNSPKRGKEEVVDIVDENNNNIGRMYKVCDKNGIINEFEIKFYKDSFFLTHIFSNPNAELDLDDEECL